MNIETLPIRSSEPSHVKCANPYCDATVTCRGEFCRDCDLHQRITKRELRARRERE